MSTGSGAARTAAASASETPTATISRSGSRARSEARPLPDERVIVDQRDADRAGVSRCAVDYGHEPPAGHVSATREPLDGAPSMSSRGADRVGPLAHPDETEAPAVARVAVALA